MDATVGRHSEHGTRRTAWRSLTAIAAIGLFSASVLWAGDVRGDETAAPAPVAAHQHDHHGGTTAMHDRVVAPAAPTNGVLAVIIPRGADAAMKASGDSAYHMPAVMRVRVGDTMTIRNDDDVPHMILYTFLMPGETDTRVFTKAGSETYSSGCAANAADFHDFTTIFITSE
jgi:plastocyanin